MGLRNIHYHIWISYIRPIEFANAILYFVQWFSGPQIAYYHDRIVYIYVQIYTQKERKLEIRGGYRKSHKTWPVEMYGQEVQRSYKVS